MNVFDRDGHVSELTFNRLGAGEAFDGKPDVLEHLEGCEVCSERRARIEAIDNSFNIAPPKLDNVVSLESKRNRTPLLAGVALAACAVMAIGVWVQTSDPAIEPDIVRIKGDGFRLDLFVKDDRGSRQASNGEEVHPGDRLGFRVANRDPGYLLIAGLDETGSVYPCYPQSATTAKFTEANPDGQDLRTAVELDDVMGRERIVAAFCPNSFTLSDVKRRLNGASLEAKAPDDSMTECTFEEVTLRKRPK